MGVFGSGAFVGFLSHLLYGPTHTLDHVEVNSLKDGKKHFQVFIRKETMKTAWHGSTDTIAHGEGKKLVAIKSYKDAIQSDSHFILPVNKSGEIVFSHVEDQEITGYVRREKSVKDKAKTIIKSPQILGRLVVVLAISAIIDTGVYEIGKYRGYRAAEKGKIPLKLLNCHKDTHQPSNALMIANNLSPIPLTFEPLNLGATSNMYVRPTTLQIQQMQALGAKWSQQNQQGTQPQQPFIA